MTAPDWAETKAREIASLIRRHGFTAETIEIIALELARAYHSGARQAIGETDRMVTRLIDKHLGPKP